MLNYKEAIKREKCLILRYKLDGDLIARDEVVLKHIGIIKKEARKYSHKLHNSAVTLQDLENEGILGLIEGLDKINLDNDIKPLTYLIFWIRHKIQSAFYKKDTVKIPRHVEKTYSMIHDESFVSRLAKNCDQDFDLTVIESKTILNNLLKCLPERENKVLELFYGLHGYQRLTLREIADQLSLSYQRVAQIRKIAERKLRKNIMLADLCTPRLGETFDEPLPA